MKLISPVNSWRITSGFGPRWGKQHNGVDIGVPSGTITRAPLKGIVTSAGFFNDDCGGKILIQHENAFGPNKMTTAYCHMSQIDVQLGQKVSKGQIIGKTGGNPKEKGAGNSLAPHLHFGLRLEGQWVDPNKYFEAGELKSGTSTKTIVFLVYIGALSYVVYSLLKKQ
jgi:murein DD-endopeptidase MepM/ murein hydrolase activator NlpD